MISAVDIDGVTKIGQGMVMDIDDSPSWSEGSWSLMSVRAAEQGTSPPELDVTFTPPATFKAKSIIF